MNEIVVMTDFGSTEGSSGQLQRAVELLTGDSPAVVDARHFYDGGNGHVRLDRSTATLHVPAEGVVLRPSVVIVYEIPPTDRHRFVRFQRTLARSRLTCLSTEARAWRNATEKHLTVGRFRRAGISQMESVVLRRPTRETATAAFHRLGRDVWTRPAIGFGGRDVFHVTSEDQLRAAADLYATSGTRWLITRDAGNFDSHGRRHQYRIVVLGSRVLRVCEHIQDNPDAPCNEAQGAVSTVLPLDAISRDLLDLAVDATRSLGLQFGGVDLVPENGGAVFEVNVHPVLDVPHGFHTVALPFVQAHLNPPTTTDPSAASYARTAHND
jgi:glutathione synthase/RimK-type ligase-like ATP-grasp enzyme